VLNLGGLSITSQQWTIEGTTVKSYLQTLDLHSTPAASSGAKTDLQPTDLTASTVAFYWIDGDNGQNTITYNVTYTATLSDNSIVRAVAGFRPVRPNPVTFSGATTTAVPAVNVSTDQLKDANGNPVSSINFGSASSMGITFSSTVSTGVGGKFALLQLIDRVATSTFANGGPAKTRDTGAFVLDAGASANGLPQYDSVFPEAISTLTAQKGELPAMVDLPAVGLTGTNLASVAVTEQFHTYLMYQPTVATGVNSIWVTLQKIDWGWNGTTVLEDGVWGVPTSTSPAFTANPGGTNSAVLPEWNGCLTNTN
jgi:hypothetical protein